MSTQRVAYNGSQYMDVAIIVIIIRHGLETLTHSSDPVLSD